MFVSCGQPLRNVVLGPALQGGHRLTGWKALIFHLVFAKLLDSGLVGCGVWGGCWENQSWLFARCN